MPASKKHPQAGLYPSELVTIGTWLALKGGHFRAFYRWLKQDSDAWFNGLPDHTCLLRLLSGADFAPPRLFLPAFYVIHYG